MSTVNNILLTGGAGYIGSHTAVALRAAGFEPVVLDNFSNSHPQVFARLEKITGAPIQWVEGNVADQVLVAKLIEEHNISAVVHFAAFKAVGESVEKPLMYFQNNVGGLLGLLGAMANTSCRSIVFSSSATVYGDPQSVPITEDMPTGYTNPYGHTKLICEQLLQSLSSLDPSWKTGVLRYFNPVGAHESGEIGEDPVGIPNNLMPIVAQVAVGRRERVSVYGSDYPTPDGTGVRDYIHVMDLAEGHVASLRYLLNRGSHLVNLGTGQGYSVLDLINAYSNACGKPIAFEQVGRRPGDVATTYADPAKAKELLGWQAKRGLAQMCESSWAWQSKNPNGYR
jgi:UDP-glucose 4-epimerase